MNLSLALHLQMVGGVICKKKNCCCYWPCRWTWTSRVRCLEREARTETARKRDWMPASWTVHSYSPRCWGGTCPVPRRAAQIHWTPDPTRPETKWNTRSDSTSAASCTTGTKPNWGRGRGESKKRGWVSWWGNQRKQCPPLLMSREAWTLWKGTRHTIAARTRIHSICEWWML